MRRIAVYCASSSKVSDQYFSHTEQLARLLVENNFEVVYGGGAVGLMGKLADTVLATGGKITGVIPHFMNDLEWAHTGLSELLFVDIPQEVITALNNSPAWSSDAIDYAVVK